MDWATHYWCVWMCLCVSVCVFVCVVRVFSLWLSVRNRWASQNEMVLCAVFNWTALILYNIPEVNCLPSTRRTFHFCIDNVTKIVAYQRHSRALLSTQSIALTDSFLFLFCLRYGRHEETLCACQCVTIYNAFWFCWLNHIFLAAH